MSEKRYQIFLSSTYIDLVQERARVLQEMARHNYIASGMEYFPAMDEEQFEFIKTVIDESDFYVAVVAGRYGSLAPDGIGYSEKEYNYAVEHSIPVIALLRSGWKALPPDARETDKDKIDMLERYRAKLSAGRLVKFWNDEAELCLALLGSLNAMSKRFPRPGWIRGGGKSPEELQLAINELERVNKDLTTLVEGPIQNLVQWRLRDELKARYSCNIDGVLQEGILKATWQDLANYVLPRIRWARRTELFHKIICEFIEVQAKKPGISIAQSEVDAIVEALSRNGLLDTLKNGFGELSYMVSSVGFNFVEDAIEKYDASIIKDSGYWEGIGRTMDRQLKKLFSSKKI